ncbi:MULTISPECIES: MFS transporter [Serratia]|jgi:MFS family permease|uniref:Predicted arabinose efflux permease, MFS family n=1 Tax=Serratia nematodiphila TaxID=458197 RepID=A0A1G5DGI0_9GAMM|nr:MULTISPECIES: MFS transporter [Serratia]ALL36420.1 ABC transporter permease [Serratia marcescens]ANM80968.1 major Facilitator Superfamily protein [Serratia marcescens]KFF87276.1 MFS transporter [Serratia nematodiphila DZ0503SBS1]MBH2602629.1 MFS transporter [Serratia marcescens]MBH2892196.1 MFS transporter [Serratia marcescens]
MANPYFTLFSAPGSKAFSSAGLIARLPISMTGIGIITMLSQVRGSYWLAGAVAATFAFSMALLAPQIARAADRYGQNRVLPYATGVSALALLLLLICTHYRAPDWTLFVFAALAGGMPSISAMVRARWSEIYRGTPQLHTAYSFESVLDEVAFIVGPPIAVGLSVALFPEAGPLAAALLLVAGVSAFAWQKSTQPPVYPRNNQRQRAILAMPSMQILVLALIALGTIVGTVDVISVAFAEQQGQPAAASIVLSVYAGGSCLAGLIFGAIKLPSPLPRQFLYAAFATALTTLPLLWVHNVLTLAAAMFVAGLFFAPTMIVAMGLVERLVPPSRLTEGLTWMVTGLGVGVALGAALAGLAIDALGIKAGFGVTLTAGLVVLLVAAGGYRLMRRTLAVQAA